MRGNRYLVLTRLQFDILEKFVRKPGQVMARSQLADNQPGHAPAAQTAAYTNISLLRKELEADGEPRIIRTVRGVGYKLVIPMPRKD